MPPKRSLRSSTAINAVAISDLCATAAKTADPKALRHPQSFDNHPTTPPSKRARFDPIAEHRKTPRTKAQNDIRPPAEGTNGVSATTNNASPLDRPAEPNRTNAPLITPRGSRLVTYPVDTAHASPSKTGIPRPTTTTGHILEQACAHLIKQEPRLQPLIEKHYCKSFSLEGLAEECDPFKSLCSGIMAQQVSGAAASSIKRKFIVLFYPSEDGQEQARLFPTPAQVAACSVPFLRQAGLSERKAEYIKGLAEKFANGELSASMLIDASDEEVLEKLTLVRGLGRWSVEMFACFGLKRMDILSTGDLGVQRGMAAFMGKDVKKLKAKGGGKWKYMSEQDMLRHSEKFAPYRSIFMWYMWRVEDVDTNVVESSM